MDVQPQFSVEDTNQQAMASKLSAIKLGYFQDHFAQQFVNRLGSKDIIMHRGYWARVFVVRKLVQTMIKSCSQVQIISLGCGLDTLWFNLAIDSNFSNSKFSFLELDLPGVVHRKIKKIEKSKKIMQLFRVLGDSLQITQHKMGLSLGNRYKLYSCDLSNTEQFQQILMKSGINPKIPTLFFCQCVLSYIDSDKVDQLLKFISGKFELSYFFDYQMFNPLDRFGKMMVQNFYNMGCSLVGVHKYPELQDQNKRFTDCGFQKNQIYTMKQMYYDCIPKTDRLNIEKIQMLDELEEWNIIMAHYFALLSSNWNQSGSKHPDFKALQNNMKLKSQH